MSPSKNSFIRDKAYIDGQWVAADSGKTFEVKTTGEVLGHVPDQGVAETNRAIEAAYKAFETWSVSAPKTRHDLLMKFYNLIVEHTEELTELITLENGKPLADARGEMGLSASMFEWYAAEAMRTYGDVIPAVMDGVRNITIKQPIGVVGIITPWNFPSAMIGRKASAALAAGCTVVIKAPPETPLSALAMCVLAEKAGIPKGVMNIITTADSPPIGKVLCTHPLIRKVSFTGSTAVGKLLAEMCSSTLKKMSMELGGNAPFIIFDDAEIDAAVAGAIGSKFRSSGQTCVCANRIFVQKGIYDKFAEKFTAAVKKFKIGNGMEKDVTHGPLIHERAVDKVEAQVKDAVSKGAKLVTGGKRAGGSFYEPTVLTNVSRDSLVMTEETFGPMAALVSFDTEDEVVKLANAVDVGLAGYFYSRDIGRIWRVAEALEVGMVGANTGLVSQVTVPFGGIKESGWGKEGSKYGIEDYMIVKLIVMGGVDSRL